MLTTEDEAKTKRCHEAYAASSGVTDGASCMSTSVPAPPIYHSYGATAMGVQIASAPMTCIGSACMAWRWRGWVDPQRADGHIFEHGDGNRATAHVGYCGKAGRP